MKHREGFTLIELSIVLVIIGLIVGGILVGRELIEAARLHNIVKSHEEFASRWNTFKLKYKGLPGDHPNATAYFGGDPACPTTCDGNGDGWIAWAGGSPPEPILVWKHLYLAGLSNYLDWPDLTAPTNSYHVVAPSRKNDAVWIVGSSSIATGLAQMYGSAANSNIGSNLRGIGLQTVRVNSVASQPRVAIETPEIVSRIDEKMDDGMPTGGKFRASGGDLFGTGTLLTCVTGSGNTAVYDFTQTEATCRYVYSVQP